MSSTRSTRRSRRAAKIKDQESSVLGSIGGAIRRAVTPILGNFLQAEEESDNDSDTDVRSLPIEIDADSFLENTTDEAKRKEGRKRAIKFEEAPSEGDTGAGIGLQLKTESEEDVTPQLAEVKKAVAIDVAKLKYKGAYIKNMKVAKIRAALKSLGLPQEGRKDVLKEKLVHAVLELHHSDPYANATPAKKNSNRSKGVETKEEQSKASPKREDPVTSRGRSKRAASNGAKKSKARKTKKEEASSTRQSKRVAKEAKVDETKPSSRSTRRSSRTSKERKVDETKLSRRSTRRSTEAREGKQSQVVEEIASTTKKVQKTAVVERKSKRKIAKPANKAGRSQISRADDTTFTFNTLMRKKKAELIELAVKHGASDKGTKKDLSNNILKAIMEQNKDESREERKVEANEIRAGASENNAPVEAEVVTKNSKRRQRKTKTATKNRTSSKSTAKKGSGSPRRKRSPRAASKRKRPVNDSIDSILPTAKRNNAISSQNERSEGVMDVDESTVSMNVQQKQPKGKEASFVQSDSDNDPTTNMVIESTGDMKMTDQQIGREYLNLLDDDSDSAEKEDDDGEKATSTFAKISENEFKSVLDRLDNEELKQRLKLAMASKSQDSSAPKVAKERDVAPVEFDIAGEDVANTTEEPIKQNRVVQPTPRVDGKEVCQVVKTLMGSHRRSAHRVNDNSLEVSDLENEAPSSFVVPFQVPNRNDRLIVHPQASFADRNGPYPTQNGAVYGRRPRQSPYGSFTPRAYNSRRASLGGNFPRSVSGHSHVDMMSQSGMSRTNRNQQPTVSSHFSSSKRARTIDLAKETQPFGTMQVSDLGGYSMDVRSLKKRRLSSSQYYSRGNGNLSLASPAYSTSYSTTPRNIYSSSYAKGYARPRTKPRNRQSLPSGVANDRMLTKSTPIGATDVAKRILDTLEQMSTPLSDARRTFAGTSSSRITSSNVQAAHARALSENNSSNDFSVSSASHDLATSPSRIFGEVGVSPDLKLSVSKKSSRKNTDNSMVSLFGSRVAGSEATNSDNDRATLPPPSIFSNYKKTSITNIINTSSAAEKTIGNAGTVSQGAKIDVVQKFVFSPPSKTMVDKSKIRAAVDEAKQAAGNTFTFDDPEDDNFESAYPLDIDEEDEEDVDNSPAWANLNNAATNKNNSSSSAKSESASSTASFPTYNETASTDEKNTISNVFAAFLPKAGEWKCKACSVMNKADAVKCVSCETPREDAPKSSGNTTTKAKTREDGKVSMFTFGSAPSGGLDGSKSTKAKGVSFQFGKPPKPSAAANTSTKQVSFGKPTTASTPSAGGFTFGGGSKKSLDNADKTKADSGTGGFLFGSAANKDDTGKPPAPSTGFTFGGTDTGDNKKEKSAPSSTGFTFGGSGPTKADNGSNVETLNSGALGDASTSTGFTFGAKTEDAKPTTGFTFGGKEKSSGESGTNADKKSGGGFTFGGAKSDEKPKAASTGFQFGSSGTESSATSSSDTSSTAKSSGFTFGGTGATKSKIPASGFTFGNNTSTSSEKGKSKDSTTASGSSLFKFGAGSSNTTSTDSSTTSSTGLAFGGSKLPTPGKDGVKNGGATKTAVGGFKFGSSDNAAAASTSSTDIPSTGFKFGSSATSTAKKDDANGVFNFGGSKSSSKLDTIKERMAKQPKGGDGGAQSKPAVTAAFQFGASSKQSAAPGSNVASKSGGAFQFGTAGVASNKSDSSSGNMFSFSGGASQSGTIDKIKTRMGTQPSDTKPASGGSFVFGAKSSNTTANSSAFGSATAGSSPNASGMTFGNSSKGSSGFGNSSTNGSGGFGQAPAKTPAFGGAASKETPSMTFGAGSNTSTGTTSGNSTSNNAFGGQSNQPSSGFGGSGGNTGFGATPSASSMTFGNNAKGSMTFGQGAQTSSNSTTFGGGASAMNFGSNNSGSTGQTFGGAAQNNNTFGGAAQNNNTFGGAAQNNSTFGGQSQQQATGFGNMAGGGGFGQTSSAAPSTFNNAGAFGAQGQQAQQPAFGGGNGGFGAQASTSFGGTGAFGQAPTPSPSPFGAPQGGGGGGFNMGKTRKKVKVRKNRRR